MSIIFYVKRFFLFIHKENDGRAFLTLSSCLLKAYIFFFGNMLKRYMACIST